MICKMIIKAIRFRSKSNVRRLVDHLSNGAENDLVCFVKGTAADIRDMHADATVKRSTYSIRHWVIAPHEATSRSQMRQVVEIIAREFDFDPKRAVIVEHKKKRAVANAHDTHWHMLVGEVDPISGRVLKCSFDRIVHELVARWSEYKFGHKFVAGKHTKSVVAGLKKRGALDAALKLETEVGGLEKPTGEAFTQDQHQEKKRAGIDLPKMRQVVKAAAASATSGSQLRVLLEASSLVVAPGQKPGTWIVNDRDGNLIGSLSRLAGVRKSDITNLMGDTRNEPVDDTANHRTNNPKRDEGDPQLAGAHQRPTNDRPGNTGPDAGQNPRLPRTNADAGGAPQSKAGSAKAQDRNASLWLKRLDGLQDQLSTFLGRANMLAMTPGERITATLWEMEQEARFHFNREIPSFKFSERIGRLRADTKNLEAELSRKRDLHFDAELRLRKSPRPRWWHFLFGIAFIFERRLQQLNVAVRQAAGEVDACERSRRAAQSRLLREELSEKEQHAKLVSDITKRKQSAGPTLQLVGAANEIVRLQPAFAFCGLDFVLSRARVAVDQAREAKVKADATLDGSSISYKSSFP
jgi:hypothetical protein